MKRWKYKVIDKDTREISKGVIESDAYASVIAWGLEANGKEVLSLSCVEELPIFHFLIPSSKQRYAYA